MKYSRARRSHFCRPRKNSGNGGVVASIPDQTMESVMWNLIDILYREYCIARLQEMRRLTPSH
jgi:hypothetical protein